MSKPKTPADRALRLVCLFLLFAVSYGWIMALLGVSFLHIVCILAVASILTDMLIDQLRS